jgi:hypothetical protein
MMYQGPAQAYFRSAVQIGISQHLSRRGIFELPGGHPLWIALGKVLLLILSIVLVLHLSLSSFIGSTEQSVRTADDALYNLTIANSLLKSQKSKLFTPEQVRAIAGDSLALYTPQKGQVRVYNRTTGQFKYL